MSETPNPSSEGALKRTGITLSAFLIPFVFIWIVFDNLALAIALAFLFAAASAATQRANRKGAAGSDEAETGDR